MADRSESRESDNNSSWVMAGPEALPVEDLRSEEAAGDAPEDPSPAQYQPAPAEEKEAPEVPEARSVPEEPKAKGPGVALDLPSGETHEASEPSPGAPAPPDKDSAPRHAQERPAASPPGAPALRKAGPAAAEDVEGLRRRKGREAPEEAAAGGGAAGGARGPGAREEGGQAIWLCGFLALLGLGLLVALGVILDGGDGPEDILPAQSIADPNDLYAGSEGKERPAPEPPGEAGLPAAREEDQAARVGSPRDPRSLEAMGALLDKMAKENQDIRLMQAELQAQKEELESLLRRTEGEAQASTWQQQSLEAENARLKEALRREGEALAAARNEVRLLRGAAGAPAQAGPEPEPAQAEARRLRSSLESLAHDLGKAGRGDVRTELSALRRKVAQALAGTEGGKEKRDREKRRKPPAGKKGTKQPREPSAVWQALAGKRYAAPRGCSGVPDCARKEGLAPVPQEAFLRAARAFLSARGWEAHLEGLAGAARGFFGAEDGLFAHDRLRFVQFLDAAEDALEELAERLGGSSEEADDFEETLLRHLGRVTPRSSATHHPAKDRGREGAGRRNGRENASRAFGQH